MVWRNSKYTFRKTNDRKWCTIKKRVEDSLNQFTTKYYARQVKAIEMAYLDGMDTTELLKLKESNFPNLLKKLSTKRKSHRSPITIQKESNWDFITLNEINPRVTISC